MMRRAHIRGDNYFHDRQRQFMHDIESIVLNNDFEHDD